MSSRYLRAVLVAAAASTMMMSMAPAAHAQAEQGDRPREGARGGGPVDRASTIQRFGLDDPALKLTAAQKAQVEKLVDAYVAEQGKPGRQSLQGQEPMQARRAAREKLNAELARILSVDQRKVWEAAQASRRPPRQQD